MNKDYAKMIEDAKAKGYIVKATFVECPGCKAEIEAYMKANGLEKRPIFMRATTGVRFTKKGCQDIIACPDGHRHIMKPIVFKECPTCKTEGCKVKIGQNQIDNNDGYCYKCRPVKESQQPVAEKKSTKTNMGHAPKPTNKDIRDKVITDQVVM